VADKAPPVVEMRNAVRFPLHLEANVKAAGSEQSVETSNISAAGCTFFVESELAEGTPLEFSIVLPPEMLGTPTAVHVHCIGRVARSFSEGGRRAVAAIIDEYKFERE
jgi:hypothetical protein